MNPVDLRWEVDDVMCDLRQAEYDYEGGFPEYEDEADSKKQKRIGALKLG